MRGVVRHSPTYNLDVKERARIFASLKLADGGLDFHNDYWPREAGMTRALSNSHLAERRRSEQRGAE